MKVLFDHQIFTLQKFGGISRYIVRLSEILAKSGHKTRISALMHQNYFLANSDHFADGRIYKGQFIKGQGRVALLINEFLFVIAQKLFKPDIVHETFFKNRSEKSKRCATVVTVYDMIHEIYPDSFPTNDKTAFTKNAAVQRADLVLCISESTRNDLLRFINTDPDKVKVTYLGFDPVVKITDKHSFSAPTQRPFLLYVGSRGGYKNFSNFVSAFAKISDHVPEIDVVAFGGGSFSESESRLFAELNVSDRLFQVGGGDDYLNAMYQKALAFVFPSLYEGFGIPPLEAMANGCPVISSNRSSMPEVVGDAGLFVDPENIEEFSKSLRTMVDDQQLRQLLIAKGFKRIKEFSWQKCAEKTLQEYQWLLDRQ